MNQPGNQPVKLCKDKDCCPTVVVLPDGQVRLTSDIAGGEGAINITPENAKELRSWLEKNGF